MCQTSLQLYSSFRICELSIGFRDVLVVKLAVEELHAITLRSRVMQVENRDVNECVDRCWEVLGSIHLRPFHYSRDSPVIGIQLDISHGANANR
jgi:hypothetical protein